MWLTSWWVAWLLNFYGFSHTNCMVFYRTPWTRYGIPWNCIGTSGNPMAFHGTPRYSMEFHGIPWNSITTSWNSVELHGIPWNSIDTPWNSMVFHGTPSILHGTPRHSMELHRYSMDTPGKFRGIPWISINFHGIPWISIDFHGIPWRYFTRVVVLRSVVTMRELTVMGYSFHFMSVPAPPGWGLIKWPFLLTPEDWLKLHSPLKTSIKYGFTPEELGHAPEEYRFTPEEFREN